MLYEILSLHCQPESSYRIKLCCTVYIYTLIKLTSALKQRLTTGLNRFQHDVEHTSLRVDWGRLKNSSELINILSREPQKGSTLEISFTPLTKHRPTAELDCPFTAGNIVMTIISKPTSDISITITVQTNMMCRCVVSVYIGHWTVLYHHPLSHIANYSYRSSMDLIHIDVTKQKWRR